MMKVHSTANSKGRVERANQTLQDRLVKELRLLNICSMDAGNAYLPEFMADFNRRFAVLPKDPRDAHRPLRPTDDLNLIFTRQETRTHSKNLTVQYNKVVYQIQTTRPSYALRNAKVTVYEDAQGAITIRRKGQLLQYTTYHKQSRQAEVVSSKSLDQKLKQAPRPADDHPWRTYGQRVNGKPLPATPDQATGPG